MRLTGEYQSVFHKALPTKPSRWDYVAPRGTFAILPLPISNAAAPPARTPPQLSGTGLAATRKGSESRSTHVHIHPTTPAGNACTILSAIVVGNRCRPGRTPSLTPTALTMAIVLEDGIPVFAGILDSDGPLSTAGMRGWRFHETQYRSDAAPGPD